MGPLAGVRVIELKGLGPGPYAGMLLADLGADVVVVERPSGGRRLGLPPEQDVHGRGKRSIVIDLKQPDGLDALLRLVDAADLLIEGFRPGVAERLGFGPETCQQRNPKLVYGRVTGWGQDGPLARAAGHDINYLALSGALAAIGPRDRPVPPLNLVGDYAGGSLFLVIGMLAALLDARQTGKGRIVDAAITDGTASLMSLFANLGALGQWRDERESNLLDGGAPHYRVYEAADGGHVAFAALEPQFWQVFVERAGLVDEELPDRNDPAEWPALRERLAALFRTRSREEWCAVFDNSDACVTPVLNLTEAAAHPHNRARRTWRDGNGIPQPAPTPRFDGHPPAAPAAPHAAGADTDAVLAEAGLSPDDLARLRAAGAIR